MIKEVDLRWIKIQLIGHSEQPSNNRQMSGESVCSIMEHTSTQVLDINKEMK